MSRWIIPVALALVTALLRAALIPSFPGPLAMIDPVLIVACWYAVAHKPGEAFAAAAVAGLVRDALSSLPVGSHLVAYCAATLVAYMLFTRIFTNHGWPGLIGLGAAAMVTEQAVLFAVRMLQSALDGFGVAAALPVWSHYAMWAQALGVQVVVMLIAFGITTWMEDSATRRYYRR